MGRYDDITPEELREQLLRFARLIRAMEKRNVLLEKTPSLLRLLGELRRMIFAYEVRVTRNLAPRAPDEASEAPSVAEPTSLVDESVRIVREALERERELQDELRDRLFPDGGEG